MNQDPRVMEYLPSSYSEEKSIEVFLKCRLAIETRGWGFWALELKESSVFIGSVGINPVAENLPIAESIEVGWRLAWEYWGSGYATEAARASISHAFNVLHKEEVVAFTAVQNRRSRRVMEKLAMLESSERFIHPDYPSSTGLSEHVLYKITRERFKSHDE